MHTKTLSNKKFMLRWPWHSPLHCLKGNGVANTALAIANTLNSAIPDSIPNVENNWLNQAAVVLHGYPVYTISTTAATCIQLAPKRVMLVSVTACVDTITWVAHPMLGWSWHSTQHPFDNNKVTPRLRQPTPGSQNSVVLAGGGKGRHHPLGE